MNWPDVFLLCFAIGSLWALASLLLSGMHLGHSGGGHGGGHHFGHGHGAHAGHAGHAHVGHGSAAHGHAAAQAKVAKFGPEDLSWLGSMANPSCAAVFLAWFGGIGYLLTRHSGLAFWIDLVLAVAVGLVGAWILAGFLRFLQAREKPLDPADYEMIGILGHVSCTIRPDGVGEVIYVRDGARRPLAARAEDGQEIRRGEEVVVTRYERGIAYVRTWDAMIRGRQGETADSFGKETKHVQ
jgi:membrane protein implicated in regulation of membrane protease activity